MVHSPIDYAVFVFVIALQAAGVVWIWRENAYPRGFQLVASMYVGLNLLYHAITPFFAYQFGDSPGGYRWLMLLGGFYGAIVLLVMHLGTRRRFRHSDTALRPRVEFLPVMALLLLAVCALHAYAAIKNGVFYARIGSEGAAEAAANMPIIDLIFIKLYTMVAIPVSIVIHVFRTKLRRSGALIWSYRLITVYVLFHTLINSRLKFALIAALLAIFSEQDFGMQIREKVKQLAVASLAAGLGFLLISSARQVPLKSWFRAPGESFAYTCENLFSAPVSGFTPTGAGVVVLRTDGLNAPSHVYETGEFVGFDGMMKPFLFLFPWTDTAKDMKRSGKTATKNDLDDHYHLAGAGAIDFPQSIFLEPYARFGAVGILLLAVVQGFMLAWIFALIRFARSELIMSFGVFLLFNYLMIEYGFLDNVLRVLMALPFYLCLVLAGNFYRDWLLSRRDGSRNIAQ